MASLSSPSQCPQIELVTKLILCPSCGPHQPFLTLDKCAQIFSFLDIFSLENLLSFQCKYSTTNTNILSLTFLFSNTFCDDTMVTLSVMTWWWHGVRLAESPDLRCPLWYHCLDSGDKFPQNISQPQNNICTAPGHHSFLIQKIFNWIFYFYCHQNCLRRPVLTPGGPGRKFYTDVP